jgi:2'-hydroxyisoflavone reductase
VDRYVYISSVSAYADLSEPGITEASPVGRIDDPTVEEITEDTYGPLKALSENVVQDVFGEGALIVRPGLVVGPHDPTDRFTYWPHRVDRGGDVLAPAPPDAGVQFIDVRDLADFTIHAVEASVGGTFNVVTEPDEFTFGSLLETCARVAGSEARFVWADPGFLLEHDVEPWMGLPLWIPEDDPEFANMMQVSPDSAIVAGLTFRTLEETVGATLEWDRARGASELKAGLPPAKESELLAAL